MFINNFRIRLSQALTGARAGRASVSTATGGSAGKGNQLTAPQEQGFAGITGKRLFAWLEQATLKRCSVTQRQVPSRGDLTPRPAQPQAEPGILTAGSRGRGNDGAAALGVLSCLSLALAAGQSSQAASLLPSSCPPGASPPSQASFVQHLTQTCSLSAQNHSPLSEENRSKSPRAPQPFAQNSRDPLSLSKWDGSRGLLKFHIPFFRICPPCCLQQDVSLGTPCPRLASPEPATSLLEGILFQAFVPAS